MSAERFGIKLKSIKRYLYRGQLYEFGKDYAVLRELRDHLVGSGYFIDTLIEAPEPRAIASKEEESAEEEEVQPRAPLTKTSPLKRKRRARKPSTAAIEV